MKWAMEEGGLDFDPRQTQRDGSQLNIPGYVDCEEIARGGMGIVYRARQIEPNRKVALKMLLPQQASSPEMLERARAAEGGGAPTDPIT